MWNLVQIHELYTHLWQCYMNGNRFAHRGVWFVACECCMCEHETQYRQNSSLHAHHYLHIGMSSETRLRPVSRLSTQDTRIIFNGDEMSRSSWMLALCLWCVQFHSTFWLLFVSALSRAFVLFHAHKIAVSSRKRKRWPCVAKPLPPDTTGWVQVLHNEDFISQASSHSLPPPTQSKNS